MRLGWKQEKTIEKRDGNGHDEVIARLKAFIAQVEIKESSDETVDFLKAQAAAKRRTQEIQKKITVEWTPVRRLLNAVPEAPTLVE